MDPLYREAIIWLCIFGTLFGGFYAFMRFNKIPLRDIVQFKKAEN